MVPSTFNNRKIQIPITSTSKRVPSLQSFVKVVPRGPQTLQPIQKNKVPNLLKNSPNDFKNSCSEIPANSASPSVLQKIVPIVLLIPKRTTNLKFKRAELLRTASGTRNNFNVGNVGRYCLRSDLSFQRVSTGPRTPMTSVDRTAARQYL